MTSLRQLLADNLREHRRRLGLSQAKLAEKADTSTQYLAMIELTHKYPSPEMIERLATALGIDTTDLFAVSLSPETVEKLRQVAVTDMSVVIGEAVEKVIAQKLEEHLRPSIERMEKLITNHLTVDEKELEGKREKPDT